MTDLELQNILSLITKVNKIGIRLSYSAQRGVQVNAPKSIPLPHDVLDELRRNKDQLHEYFIKYGSGEVEDIVPIPSASRSDIPLSFNQERLWFIDQTEGTLAYHCSQVFEVEGVVKEDILALAFKEIVQRHEILRTVYDVNSEGYPIQRILDIAKPNFKIHSQLHPDRELRAGISQVIARPFDLRKDLMIRVHLLRLTENKTLLILTVHHIAFDGWSFNVLLQEFSELYNAALEGRQHTLKVLPLQYGDYAAWQRTHLTANTLLAKLEYWKSKLAGFSPTALPYDFNRTVVNRSGKNISFEIGRDLAEGIASKCLQLDVTQFMFFLSVFKLAIYKHSGETNICVGTSIANRQQRDVGDLIGFFANTLPLRTELDTRKSFMHFVAEVKETVLDAFKYQDAPFSKIVDTVAKEKGMTGPLFHLFFEFTNASGNGEASSATLTDMVISPFSFENDTAKFDLSLNLIHTAHSITGIIEYTGELYTAETIGRFIEHYVNLLSSTAANPACPVSKINMLGIGETRQVVNDFNATLADYPRERTIAQLVEEQVRRTPHAVAVEFESQQLTYAELNAKANALGDHLRSQGVQREIIVPVILERSMELPVAVLAVWKAGGACLLIDPETPYLRIKSIINEVNAGLILNSKETDFIKIDNVVPITMDTNLLAWYKNDLECAGFSTDLCYVIFTSGSTGTPKGVLVEHRSKINHIFAFIRQFEINHESIVAQTAPTSFDIWLWQLVAPLMVGGKSVIYSKDLQLNVEGFYQRLINDGTTVLEVVPSYFSAFTEVLSRATTLPQLTLKRLISTGEELKVREANRWLSLYPKIPISNVYGPTEASDDVTIFNIDHELTDERIPIGKPIQNVRIYIMDEFLELVGIGVPGQIVIAGECLSRGYFNRQLTEQRFVKINIDDELVYLTGDVGKWTSDGTLLYYGRKDLQVKLRGHRIELGEIENVTMCFPGISAAVVVLDDSTDTYQKKLIAYFCSPAVIPPDEIKNFLSLRLPAYMLPSHYVRLTEIPLTENGKVDRARLHPPIEEHNEKCAAQETLQGKKEEMLATAWHAILIGGKGANEISRHDNFFEQGGDSIMSIQVSSYLGKFGMALAVPDILTYPILHEMARRIKLTIREIPQEAVQGISNLSPVQKSFFRHIDHVNYYNQSVLLKFDSRLFVQDIERILNKLVDHHDTLRSRFLVDQGKWQQSYLSIEPNPFLIKDFDLVEKDQATGVNQMSALCQQLQSSLNIEQGPLIKAALIHLSEGDRLFVVIHHLVTDGVSWRILLDDIKTLIHQLNSNQQLELSAKTDSYKHWVQRIHEYATSEVLLKQTDYWRAVTNQDSPKILPHYEKLFNCLNDAESVSFGFDPMDTKDLLTFSGKYHGAAIGDTLLCGLSLAVHHVFGVDGVLVDLEGHGRELIVDDLDITRTVGWFTSCYPVYIPITKPNDIQFQIAATASNLSSIPQKGIGYGILKYITPGEFTKGINFDCGPEIGFNYLGQWEANNEQETNDVFKFSSEDSGKEQDPDNKLEHLIEVSGLVNRGQLQITLQYSRNLFDQAKMKMLSGSYKRFLNRILEFDRARIITKTGISKGATTDISTEDLNEIFD